MSLVGTRVVLPPSVVATDPGAVSAAFRNVVEPLNSLLQALQTGGLRMGGVQLDGQRSAVPTGTPGAADPTVVAVTSGGVTTYYGWNGSGWTVFGPPLTPNAVAQGTAASPTGTTSLTAVMLGLGLTVTPVNQPRLDLRVTAQIGNTTAADGVTVQVRYGTGTAPANGDAVTGTAVGASQTFTAATAGATTGVTLGGVVTGLTLGTAYWVDVAIQATTGGTASATGVTATAVEV